MSNFRNGLPFLGLAALTAALTGCADESPWGNTSNEKGSIDISLMTNNDIESSIPTFFGDEETRAGGDPYNLSTYVNVPTADDFKIKLEKKDGSFSKTWNTLAAFKRDAENQFVTGSYTLTASYGEKGKIAFNNPYFETGETFTVLANETHKLDLNASLTNSMVKINFTDDFKNYMSDYYVGLRTEGQTDEFKYQGGEPRPVFVEPDNTDLTVHFTTKDSGITTAKKIGQFIPVAKTLHNLTFDVRTVNGKTSLGVLFNDSLETENVYIDLSDCFKDMMKAPTITCKGFENGGTVNLLEGSASQNPISMEVVAEAGIQEAILTVSTTSTLPDWGREIDLCKATDEQQRQLAEAGIDAKGFFKNPEKAAIIDFTKYGQKLREGRYTISLQVTDKNNNVSDPIAKAIFDFEKMKFENVSGRVNYGSKDATLKFDYNGFDPSELEFKAYNKSGDEEIVTVNSFSETNSTRSFECKSYTFNLTLPTEAIERKIEINAYNKNNNIPFGKFYIELNSIPTYSISEIDAYSKYAYMKVDAPAALLATITENIRFDNNSLFIDSRDTANGIITVTGPKVNGEASDLTAGKTYTPNYSIFRDDFSYGKKITFTAETALDVPNGDFETLNETINITIQQGGKWTQTNLPTAHRYTTTLSMQIKEPAGWYSSNPLTCNLSSGSVNSWYTIPSVYNTSLTWVSNQPEAKVGVAGQSAYTSTADIYKNASAASGSNAMVIRNVAWDNNGPSISDDQKTGNATFSNYYCSKKPSSIANRSAGYMRLGSASSEGTAFSSRPAMLKGKYKYQQDSHDTEEKGVVTVKILNGSQVIGSGSIELGPQDAFSEFEVPITYTSQKFNKKATSLQISITSSNRSSNIKTTDYCDKEECCSRGASLTVDKLSFEY